MPQAHCTSPAARRRTGNAAVDLDGWAGMSGVATVELCLSISFVPCVSAFIPIYQHQENKARKTFGLIR
jgi:hypothetical protein